MKIMDRFCRCRRTCLSVSTAAAVLLCLPFVTQAEQASKATTNPSGSRPKRLLLLGQKPDGHPAQSHEYIAGVRLLAKMIQNCEAPSKESVPHETDSNKPAGATRVQTLVVQADDPWADGPELLDGADGVVLFLTEGAKWISANPDRLAAFQKLAKRGGGLTVLHWGMGTCEAAPVENFTSLFGLCHGGPDRRYKIITAKIQPMTEDHPVCRGLAPVEVHDEFYFELKRPSLPESSTVGKLVPLIRVRIDDVEQTVAWGWDRPDGGRSFGFSGLHYHANWKHPEYRRLVLQGVMWSIGQKIPAQGLSVDVAESDLIAPPPAESKAVELRPTERKPQSDSK